MRGRVRGKIPNQVQSILWKKIRSCRSIHESRYEIPLDIFFWSLLLPHHLATWSPTHERKTAQKVAFHRAESCSADSVSWRRTLRGILDLPIKLKWYPLRNQPPRDRLRKLSRLSKDPKLCLSTVRCRLERVGSLNTANSPDKSIQYRSRTNKDISPG